MPEFIHRRWHGLHMVLAFVLLAILTILLYFYHWLYLLVGGVAIVGLAVYAWYAEKSFREDFIGYVAALTYRIRRAGDKVVQNTPVGMILYDEEAVVVWHNPFSGELLRLENFVGVSLLDVLPVLAGKLEENGRHAVHWRNRVLQVDVHAGERLLFLTDITEITALKERYEAERPAIGIVHIDNLEEVTQGMDEKNHTLMLAEVTRAITDWAAENDLFIRRAATDKFLVVTDMAHLAKLQEDRFQILDRVREMTKHQPIPFTLSIGFGAAGASIPETGQMASSSLEIALGRGGDQAAVRIGDKLTFYGGKSNAVEKRTRVRVRVVSHAMRNLILESDHVLIMGHKFPDMDALGAAIGVWKMVTWNEKRGYIVLDESNPAIDKLVSLIREDETLAPSLVTPDEAYYLCTPRTLVVMVDNHRPSMAIEPRLLQMTRRVMVIDHHRRSDDIVEDPLLLYIEPYASSTSELVTELLQYQTGEAPLSRLEATALLSGIIVDTNHFHFRTGVRTFEAASYLRKNGAEPEFCQQLLKQDLHQFLRRAELLQQTELLPGGMAVAVGAEDKEYEQLVIAQAADSLLSLDGVKASFVIARRPDGLINISARSWGDVNVQVIMEQMGGGGHLTNAAAQLADSRIQEVRETLRQVLASYVAQAGKGDDGK
ncbi:MAG: hypothetical protein A6D91_02925 [Bacillaceae bacterium G1]|nr:hypothetical protein [Bacillota bacterium]OJF17865.1 MAG: hypothetical protein A6D91_02925 [Bacillaceae bacterium G1]